VVVVDDFERVRAWPEEASDDSPELPACDLLFAPQSCELVMVVGVFEPESTPLTVVTVSFGVEPVSFGLHVSLEREHDLAGQLFEEQAECAHRVRFDCIEVDVEPRAMCRARRGAMM
jgi:hypothetical protein